MNGPRAPSQLEAVDIELDYRNDIQQTSKILAACIENKPCVLGNTLFNFLSFILLMGIIAIIKWMVTQKMEFYAHNNNNQPI